MGNETKLPFKVGQKAEARSFQRGFRGAWFRSKIPASFDLISSRFLSYHCTIATSHRVIIETDMNSEKVGRILLQYYDYPDEKKPKWLKLYQVPPYGSGKEKYRELMLRPCYPPVYKAKQMPHASVISEVSVIVDDSWKVGDMVDWMTENCFWSGSITQLFGGGKAQIELKNPPHGEGYLYEADLVDVRPSLDWSPEYGWTMPTQEGECGRPSAWLLKPINQDVDKLLQITDTHNSGQETESGQSKAGSSLRLPSSSQVPSTSAASDEVKSTGTTEISKRSNDSTKLKNTQKRSTSRGHRVVKTDSGQTSAEPKADVAADMDDINSDCSTKKYIDKGGSPLLNSTRSDTLEAAVLDLEEYVNKVKWLKTILGCEVSSGNQWEFVEPLAASDTPK
ncbi:hypothetical protein PHJA_001733200 [Phtheirospermum japonicum]|uniref:Agenet domain-containing protein n=1 Tax=Phtheirospermum japonicum TaxID=374723 RepID=A0A830C8K1_9LAMI|nr:hypothetical protein PHJA_001733200 [Phtheirospermum japonicum]